MRKNFIYVCTLVALAMVTDAVSAQSTTAVDYAEALRQVNARSGSIIGADLDFQAKKLQADDFCMIPPLRKGRRGEVEARAICKSAPLAPPYEGGE